MTGRRNDVRLVVWYIHSSAGGPSVGSYIRPYELAKHWANLGIGAVVVSPGFHHLMESGPRGGPEVIGGVRYFFTRARSYAGNGVGRILAMFQFMMMAVLQSRSIAALAGWPDVIIASSPHPFGLVSALILRKLCGARVIFEVRDIWPASILELSNATRRNPFILLLAWLEKLAMRRSDAVVSLLEHALPHMQACGLEPRRFHWIPNGVGDLDETVPVPSRHRALLANLAGPDCRLVVIYGGMIGVANNLDLMLDVAARRQARGDRRITFAIAGDGVRRQALADRIAREGLQDVHLLEKVPRAEWLDMLGQADIGYISLADSPLFNLGVSPNKVFDYMLAGRPVLFAIRSAANIVERAGCGLVAEPTAEAVDEALEQFLSMSADERHEIGLRGRKHVAEYYTYALLAQRYSGVFATLRSDIT